MQFRWATAWAKGQGRVDQLGTPLVTHDRSPAGGLTQLEYYFSLITWRLTIGNSGLVEWLFNAIRDLISFYLPVQPSGHMALVFMGFIFVFTGGSHSILACSRRRGRTKLSESSQSSITQRLPHSPGNVLHDLSPPHRMQALAVYITTLNKTEALLVNWMGVGRRRKVQGMLGG